MNILITGGNGMIGKVLVKRLRENNHKVRVLTRQKTENPQEFYWNLDKKIIDEKAFDELECIIHLAGANISERWNDSYKKELITSRICSANLLREYCEKKNIRLKSFISASGINYYGTFTSDQILNEDSGTIHPDFLAKLCVDWENAAENFSDISERIACLRTAMVLSNEGGAFPLLQKTVDFNVGSAVGSGKQWMNWIHLEDLVKMYVFAVENSEIHGKYNAVADEVVTNELFMKKLAKISNKFFIPITVPSFILRTIFGEMSGIILKGTRASNKKIKSQGFDFKFNELDEAFSALV